MRAGNCPSRSQPPNLAAAHSNALAQLGLANELQVFRYKADCHVAYRHFLSWKNAVCGKSRVAHGVLLVRGTTVSWQLSDHRQNQMARLFRCFIALGMNGGPPSRNCACLPYSAGRQAEHFACPYSVYRQVPPPPREQAVSSWLGHVPMPADPDSAENGNATGRATRQSLWIDKVGSHRDQLVASCAVAHLLCGICVRAIGPFDFAFSRL